MTQVNHGETIGGEILIKISSFCFTDSSTMFELENGYGVTRLVDFFALCNGTQQRSSEWRSPGTTIRTYGELCTCVLCACMHICVGAISFDLLQAGSGVSQTSPVYPQVGGHVNADQLQPQL